MAPRARRRFLSEISTTPFVDVMLVLLVIVMVGTAVKGKGVEVELPRTRTVQSLPKGSGHFVLSMDADGRIFMDTEEVDRDHLKEYLVQRVLKQDKAVFLRADKDVPYGEVVRVMAEIREAGVPRIGIVAEPEDQAAPGSD
ncbi:ExbD/TolR family protein [Paucidesulfovibrio longus]|uniref:ExbD/TolR family protein n=1 Tax=Paucidesulfovibrio longus TaxID=889 RepID=UPI0003B5A035|nr:biopolymer transporter ExbD [Paucidesulfovibrio longus]